MELQEILDIFLTKDNFTILTHKSPDGDTLGSGFALCYFLRGLGKHANVLNSDKLPDRYGFIYKGYEPQEFEQEYKRLTELPSSENPYVYGATEFPYELCAVYADDYFGYIYAMADRSENRLIYVELQFANGFTDIAYKKYMDEKYLPIGFDAEYKWWQ